MGLTLITGRANAGKTGVLLASLRNSATSSQPVLVLPQVPDVRRAAREFVEKGIGGIRPVVFDDWIGELWLLHGDGRRFVGDAARVAVIARAVREAGLRSLAESAMSPGFPALFADLMARVVAPVSASTSGTARELATLIDTYRRLLADDGLIEATDAAVLLSAEPPEPGGTVGVNRFGDLSRPQEMVLVALSAVAEVEIALTWEQGSAATEALTPLVARLLGCGARHIVATESSWTDDGLARLEEALFEQRPLQQAPAGLSLGLAAGAEAECALAARAARRVLDAGADPSSVVVAFRNAGGRAGPLSAALSAQGVPASIDVSLSFGMTPLGSALLALTDACSDRGDVRERLSAYLLTPYSGVSPDEASQVDRLWRSKRTPPEQIVGSAVAELPAAAETIRLARRITRAAVDVGSAKEWKNLADRMLAAVHRRRGLSGFAGDLDAAAHRAFVRVIADIAETNAVVHEGDLSRALRATRVSTGRSEEEGRVLVTEAHRLRGRRFDTVILGGLTFGEFSSERRESLASRLADRLGQPSGVDARLAERMLFYTMVTRARRSLVLVRQATDMRGETIRPSVFFDEVLDVYRTPEQAAEGEIPAGVVVDHLSLADLVAAAPALLPGRRILRANAQTYAPSPPPRGRLTSASVLEALAQRDEFSVSEIETYLGCPYRWYLQRALRPEEIDSGFDSRERGSLAHELLSSFYTRWRAQGRTRVCAGELGEALEVLEDIARESSKGPGTITTLENRLSEAKAHAWVRSVIEDDATFLPGFVPEHHELRFGVRHDAPVEFAGVKLAGSIDRVDVSAKGLVVIDYKSSGVVEGRGSFGSKGLIQIPVYGVVASSLLGLPLLGGVYRSLQSLACRGFWDADSVDLGGRGIPRDGLDAAGAEAMIAEAATRVRAAVGGIRAGHITPTPLTARACAYCDAWPVCGHGRRAS